MNKYYEKMKSIVERDVGEIPKIITSDWLMEKYNDENSCFKFWYFTYSDLRGHIFDKNIPYELKRRIDFSTKTLMDDNDLFKLGLQKYHYINIKENLNVDIKDVEKNGKSRILSTSCRDVIEEYLSNNQHIDVNIKDNPRLIVK